MDSKKGRPPRLTVGDSDDFRAPQGGPKITKNRKNAFQKLIEKKEANKKAMTPVTGEGRRSRGSPGNPKILLRKALAKSGKQL